MTVLLCPELGRLGHGLDLDAVEAWLAERAPGIEVRRAGEGCAAPDRWLDEGLKGTARLVLGVCASRGDRRELDARARRLGLDPFGLQIVALGAWCAPTAKLLLAAAIAKAQAYPGSRTENAKPILSWREPVSRRALFTLPPVGYEPVPSIQEARCAAGQGCRICAETCPREALRASGDGRMTLDKAACTGCGACVSVCPREAFDFPGAALVEIEAQVAALLDPDAGDLDSRGILFACQRGIRSLEEEGTGRVPQLAGWLPVAVPCAAMVIPTWILQSLNQGAAAVALAACRQDDCRSGRREVTEGRVDYCRELLRSMGGAPDSVSLLTLGESTELAQGLPPLEDRRGPRRPPPRSIVRGGLAAPSEPPQGSCAGGARARTGGCSGAVLALAERYGARPDGPLAHPYSPLGVVELNEGCTGCARCALACPTGALASERDGDEVALTFDPRLCVGCEACVPVCPEAVVRVERVTDLRQLLLGKHTLFRDTEARCERCGAPVAPRAMLARIAALLGSDPAIPAITRYCPGCRGTLF